MLDAVIGLGSNLGDRRLVLSRAAASLRMRWHVSAVSSLYVTDPVGGPEQPDYLNAAVRVSADCAPVELLDSLLGVENVFGRVRRHRWEPRVLDLDILWIRGEKLETDRLIVPHPRLFERAFAMIPLLEIAPDARDAVTGSLLLEVPVPAKQGVRVLCGPGWERGTRE